MCTHLYNLNIVNMDDGSIANNTSVLISDGIITQIGEIDRTNEARLIDASGLWAIPSFIDMHAHVTFDGRSHHPSLTSFSYNEDDAISLTRGAQNLIEAIHSGICLIRDLGARGEKATRLKALVDSRKVLGPELILSGEPLCIPGGHGYEFGKAITSNYPIRKVLEEHVEAGYKWLKIMNGPEVFDQWQLIKIVEMAHNFGLKVAVHAFTKPGIFSAIQSDVDTIEHSIVYDDETLDLAIKNKIGFVPTYYSSKLSLRQDYIQHIYPIEQSYLTQWYNFLKDNIVFHLKNNLPIMMGTDAGCAPSTFLDITSEIKIYCQYGMTAYEAIKNATLLPAITLECEDKYGSIGIGKWANIILLKNNPLEDICNLDGIVAIWYRGVSVLDRLEAR